MKKQIISLIVAALLLSLCVATAAFADGQTYYVDTNGNGSLKLREGPGTAATVLGQYKEGTAVTILQDFDYEWYKVSVDGKTGFMMKKYLSSLAPGATPTPKPAPTPRPTPVPTEDSTMYVVSTNGKGVNLRDGASTMYASIGQYPVGTKMIVTAKVGSWAFGQMPDGQSGYMMLKFLSANDPSVTPAPAATKTPPPMTEDTTLYIQTGNSGKLNLRADASSSSTSLGKYENGTAVVVTHREDGWAYAHVDGKTGWMMLKFLTAQVPGSTPTPKPLPTPPAATEDTQMYVQTGNTGKLNLRSLKDSESESLGKYENGTPVRVTHREDGWAYVKVDTKEGWMMLKFLTSQDPSATPTPKPGQTPTPVTENTLMIVKTGNTGKLNLRADADKDSKSLGMYANGTEVTVTHREGQWAYVTVDGQKGCMMLKYLANPDGTVDPDPGFTPTESTEMYIRTDDGLKLHLRQKPSRDAISLGLYSVGTKVTVIGRQGAWAKVEVGGKTGWMMMQYLYSGATPTPAAPTATPAAPTATSVPSDPTATPVPADPTNTPAPTTAPTATPEPTATPTVAPTATPVPTATPRPNKATVYQKSGSYVNLRSSMHSSTTANVIAKIPSGTVVDIISWGGTYTKVSYNGQTGYIITSYLK